MPPDDTAALRSELEAAKQLCATLRGIIRAAREQLEKEQRDNASCREYIAELEKQAAADCKALGHSWQVNGICARCGALTPEQEIDRLAELRAQFRARRAAQEKTGEEPGGNVCPTCLQNRPEEQDWRGGMCSACFVAGEVAP